MSPTHDPESDPIARARRMTEFFARVNVKWLAPLGLPPGAQKGLVRVVP